MKTRNRSRKGEMIRVRGNTCGVEPRLLNIVVIVLCVHYEAAKVYNSSQRGQIQGL